MNQARYNTFTRFIHWAMAIGLIWMAVTALSRLVMPESDLTKWLFSTHKSVGMLLLVAALVRLVWTLTTLRSRPSATSKAASLGQILLYALMITVPFIGWLRQYSSDRAFSVFGLELLAAGVERGAPWMGDLGGLLHGELGWVLLALVLGHVVMALIHTSRQEYVMKRII